MKTLNTRQFEYSQNYMMFWDKVERANFVLEAVIETADRPTDDRVIQHLMSAPVEDAGQWDMFVNLVDKYGVVPKEAMPETESSGNTRQMNNSLYYQVRQGAAKIRQLYRTKPALTRCGRPRWKRSQPSIESCASTSAARLRSWIGSGATKTASSTATAN